LFPVNSSVDNRSVDGRRIPANTSERQVAGRLTSIGAVVPAHRAAPRRMAATSVRDESQDQAVVGDRRAHARPRLHRVARIAPGGPERRADVTPSRVFGTLLS
jgi:hypothetical protein